MRFAAHLLIAVTALVAGLLCAAPGAMAEIVSVNGADLIVDPTANEVNVITVARVGDTYTVRDTAAPLQTNSTCTLSGDTVTCPAAGLLRLRVNLGAGDDELTVDPSVKLKSFISGRAGEDTIRVRNGVSDPQVDCGADEDLLTTVDPGDFVFNCEYVDNGVPPDTRITSPPPAAYNPVATAVRIGFSATDSPGDAPLTVRCRLDGGPASDCTSPFAVPTLPDGQHTFGVRATDRWGNAAPEATASFIVDTTAPTTTITSAPPDMTEDRTPTFEFRSSESASTFICQVDDNDAFACNSPFTFPELPNGDYTFRVFAVDAVGNQDGAGAARRFIVASPTPPPPGPPTAVTNPPVIIVLGSVVLISGRTAKMSKTGVVPVSLNCAGSRPCKGKLTLTTESPVRITARKIARLGGAKFRIKPKRSRLIRVRLGKTARKLVKRLRQLRVRATIREVDLHGHPRISSRVFTLRR